MEYCSIQSGLYSKDHRSYSVRYHRVSAINSQSDWGRATALFEILGFSTNFHYFRSVLRISVLLKCHFFFWVSAFIHKIHRVCIHNMKILLFFHNTIYSHQDTNISPGKTSHHLQTSFILVSSDHSSINNFQSSTLQFRCSLQSYIRDGFVLGLAIMRRSIARASRAVSNLRRDLECADALIFRLMRTWSTVRWHILNLIFF